MNLHRSMLAVLLTLAVPACKGSDILVEPPLPYGAVAVSPPAVYETWWHQVEACAQVTGDFHSVHWYTVPASTVFTYDGDSQIEGLWLPRDNKIFIAGLLSNDSLLVRHEELHALLQSGQHPPLFFETRCGDLVAHGY